MNFTPLINSLFQSTEGILTIFGIIIVATVFTTKFVVTTNTGMKNFWKLRKEYDTEIPDIKESLYDLREIPNMKKSLDDIKESLQVIYTKIDPKRAVFQKKSPATLTAVGKKIAKTVEAEAIIEKNMQKLKHLVAEKKPTTNYDLEKACFYVVDYNMEKILNNKELIAMKDQSMTYGLPLSHTLTVFAILLRNKLEKQKV